MQDVALYNEQVTGPQHALIVANRARRAALGDRGVAHLAKALLGRAVLADDSPFTTGGIGDLGAVQRVESSRGRRSQPQKFFSEP